MYKKLLIILFIISISISPSYVVNASSDYVDGDIGEIYTITLSDGTFLFEKAGVEVGDIYINNSFEEYIVISLDENFRTGIAEFSRVIVPPKVDINYNPTPIDTTSKTICMYSTHNDESYITGDGVDSVYGAGGIHDVAQKLKSEFSKLGINTVYDETLHIPHDTSAYNRSKVTASSLMEDYAPNAIFDIHRDGASRSTYVSTYNGQEVCKIRMVIGKSNSNYAINQEFAVYLMSVAKEIHPWLFLDIYFGKGHYNQGLSNKAILFEMGSHLVEKELVLKSVEPLAEVINVALFGTTVEEDGSAVIGGNTTVNPTIDEYFNDENLVVNKDDDTMIFWAIGIMVLVVSSIIGVAYFSLSKFNKNVKRK